MAFWREKTLAEMTVDEWEALCDGCGQCCLHKLEDLETGRIFLTNVSCHLLDCASGRCRNYPERFSYVPDCLRLTPERLDEARAWLPTTCGYRRMAEGKDLPSWHPLRSARPESTQGSAASIVGWTVSEHEVAEDALERYIVAECAPLSARGA
jgi:hypothetical protein